MNKLVRLGFISISDPPLSDKDIEHIKNISLIKNKQLEITGILYIHREINLQTFEGTVENIDKLMQSVMYDKRHKNIKILNKMEIENKLNPDDPVKIIRVKNDNSKMIKHLLDLKDKYIKYN